MSALEVGLYRATVRGVPDTIVLMDQNGIMGHHDVLDMGDGVGGTHSHEDTIIDARPLIVLDLNPKYKIPVLVEQLRGSGWRWIADQIAAQTKPARIPEPGLWGVVEASGLAIPECAPTTWVHDQYGWTSHGGLTVEWRNLIDPVLIREGIEP